MNGRTALKFWTVFFASGALLLADLRMLIQSAETR
jgi:hypothetical protein